MKRAALIILTVLATSAAAGAPAEDFVVFVRKFRAQPRFREARVLFPLPVREGSSCEDPNLKSKKWNRAQFRKGFTVPLTINQLEGDDLSEQIKQPSESVVEVFQFRDEADSYLIRYTFALRRGVWFLVRYEDASC